MFVPILYPGIWKIARGNFTGVGGSLREVTAVCGLERGEGWEAERVLKSAAGSQAESEIRGNTGVMENLENLVEVVF